MQTTLGEITVKIYFDTGVWIAPFDGWRKKEQIDAINEVVEAYKNGSIVLCTSRKVEEELQNIISHKPDKKERAENAIKWMKSIGPQSLPFRPAIFGEAIFGEALYGQGYEFDKVDLRNQDWQIAEFLTANGIQYFVSVDTELLKRIKGALKAKGSEAVLPEELSKRL